MSKETKDTIFAFVLIGIVCGIFAASLIMMGKAIGSYIEQYYNPYVDCIRILDPSVCN